MDAALPQATVRRPSCSVWRVLPMAGCPSLRPSGEGLATWERLQHYAREAGRDPAALGLEGRIRAVAITPDVWRRELHWWQEAGASHVNIDTRRGGFRSLDAHLAQLRHVHEAVSP